MMMMEELQESKIPSILKEQGDGIGKWLYVSDIMELLQVSKTTVFKHLREGKYNSIKSKNRRLISTGSFLGYLLKIKVLKPMDVNGIQTKKEVLYSLRSDKNKGK
jgi:hypothetical protein